MTRVLILGGAGMLGHKMWQVLPRHLDDVHVTIRKPRETYARYGLFESDRVVDRLDVADFGAVERVLNEIAPDVILNCVGMTYRHPSAGSMRSNIALNALFPHQLAGWAAGRARVIHFSTDCVFDGAVGGYTEASRISSDDVYGRTKSLGEITGPGCVTLRSSMIGRELERGTELVEWLLAQAGKRIKGYRKAIFTGLSTLLWTRVVVDVITNHPGLEGLFHVVTDPISKYDLLRLLAEAYRIEVQIDPDDQVVCYRNLDGGKYAALAGFRAPPWKEIVAEMAADPTPYSRWRQLT